MRKVVLALGVFFPFCTGTSFATPIWAPGVSWDSGWYDVNKYSTSNVSTEDRNFCWAAVASNMLQWWCDSYERAGNTVPTNIMRDSKTKYTCGIFENVFLKNWDIQKGAGSYEGLQWFFEGKTPPQSNYSKPSAAGNYFSSSPEVLTTMDTAYTDYCALWNTLNTADYSSAVNTQDYAVCLGGNYYTWGTGRPIQNYTTKQVFSNFLVTMLKRGPVGLSFAIGYNGNGKNHEITVWGCIVDEEGIISRIIVSDSDDTPGDPLKTVLKEYIVSYTGNYVAIDYNEAKMFGGNYITSLTGIMGYPIPEPSSFGLLAGLGALALVASRRSRCKRNR